MKTAHPLKRDHLALMPATTYKITVRGRLSERFAANFAGMRAEPAGSETALVADLVDQSQLYGLLNHLRDLGVELVGVERVAP